MKITSSYEIGQRIWCVYEHDGEVHIYDANILEVIINKNGISYAIEETYETIDEKDVILYGDSDKLYMKICDLMDQIHEKERCEQDG